METKKDIFEDYRQMEDVWKTSFILRQKLRRCKDRLMKVGS